MDIGRMMPSTLVDNWTKNYVRQPKIVPGLSLATAVSSKTFWIASDGKLSITNASASSNILVPNSDFFIKVKMWGAGGGGSTGTAGAGGGYTEVIVPVTAGIPIVCAVGGGGVQVADTAGAQASGGVNGGGYSYRAGSGGGYSGIFKGYLSFANAIAIAGGGGGGGHGQEGGAGGGTTGQDGAGSTPGGGGTQSAGGAGNQGGTTGGQLQGGTGAGDWGAGGGGGYYGGGGSGETPGQVSAAGGGSGFYSTSLCLSGTTTQGNRATPANSGDADRGTAGNSQTAGKIVIEIL